jgi:MOSC domain-containing protein YiiM
LPSEIGSFRGKKVLSGIRKEPVTGSVIVRKLNLDGDRQADLTVHGGVDKAVYVYPSENYPFWKNKFPDLDIRWGTFGENFTTEGLHEDSIHIGDRLIVGSAEFAVTQPRFPCYKLEVRFGANKMTKLFLESLRSGFYLKVLKEGRIEAGDEIRVIGGSENSETVESAVRTFLENEKAD